MIWHYKIAFVLENNKEAFRAIKNMYTIYCVCHGEIEKQQSAALIWVSAAIRHNCITYLVYFAMLITGVLGICKGARIKMYIISCWLCFALKRILEKSATRQLFSATRFQNHDPAEPDTPASHPVLCSGKVLSSETRVSVAYVSGDHQTLQLIPLSQQVQEREGERESETCLSGGVGWGGRYNIVDV